MAIKQINLGSSAGAGDGEPLYSALQKTNENFTDHETRLNTIENGVVRSDGTVTGNIVPDTDVTYDLGSSSKKFKDLYLSGNTITLGNQTISSSASGINTSGNFTTTGTIQATTITSTAPSNLSGSFTGDLKGSVYSDGSATMIDGVAGLILGDVRNGLTTTGVLETNQISNGLLAPMLITANDSGLVITNTNLSNPGAIPGSNLEIRSENNAVEITGNSYVSIISGLAGGPYADMDIYGDVLTLNGGQVYYNHTNQAFSGTVDFTGATVTGLNIQSYDQTLNTTDTVTFNTVSLGNGAVIKDNADSSVSFGGGAGTTGQGAGAVAIGEGAGNNTQSDQAVAIGRGSGNYQQGVGAVGVGFCAGATEQGDYAVAIGFKAARGNMDNDGTPNQPANSIMINASSTPLNGNQAGLYINPVREDTGNITKAIYYNTTTKELTYADPTGGGGDGANLVSDNDINITINSPDSTTYSWNFNQLGRIQIPDVNNQVAGYIGDVFETGGGLTLQSVAGGYVELTSSDQNIGFWIQELNGGDPLVNAEATLYTTGGEWSFYQDGRTAFPGSIDLGGYDLKRSSTLVERYGGVGSASGNVAVLDKYRHMTLNNQIGTVLTGNFTVNFTSVDLPSGYIARFSVFLRQGATGYYPNVFQINGVTQTLVWDGGTPPTPTSSAGAVDVFEFILYSGGSFGTATGRAILSSSSGGGEVVDDTTPQLGGNLDVNGNSIVSVSDGDINLAPNGSGEVTVTGNATISNVAKAYEMIVTSSNAALKLGDGTGSEGYMNIYLNNVSGGAKHIIQSYPTAGGGFKIQNLVNDQAITFETKNSSGTTKTPLILNGDGSVTFGSILTLPVLSSAPSSPSNGMVAIADGTNWNPTSTGTETMVVYLGGAWRTIANA